MIDNLKHDRKIARNFRIILVFGLALLPFAIWLILIDYYGVNIPFADQWYTPGEQLIAYFSGNFKLSLLFKQHNESRKVFPKLIFMILPILTGEWNTRWEMFLGLAFAGFMSLVVLLLLQRTNPKHLFQNLILVFFYNCLLLNLRAYFSWLNGITLHRLFPDACLLLNALVFTLPLPPLTKTALFIAGAAIAQYSFASGILVWFLSLPLILALDSSKYKKIGLALLYGLSCLLSCLIYFADYHQPSSHTSVKAILNFSPSEMMLYGFAFLGNLFTYAYEFSAAIGLSLLIAFCAILWRWRGSIFSGKILPWIVIGIYPISLAVINTITRLPMGKVLAMETRYIIHLVYLPLSIISLMVILANRLSSFRLKKWTILSSGLMLGLLIINTFDPKQLNNFAQFNQQLQQGKACVQLLNFQHSNACNEMIYSEPSQVYALDNLGLLQPGIAKSLNINRTQGNWGAIEVLERNNAGIHLEGWAVLERRPADALVILRKVPNQPPRVVDIWATGKKNDNIKFPSAWWKGSWEGTLSAAQLPDNTDLCVLSFYGIDTDNNQLFPIKKNKKLFRCQ